MDSVRLTWEDGAVISSFRRLDDDTVDALPPQLAPASDWSSSTQSDCCSQTRVRADTLNECQKDDELLDWAVETTSDCDCPDPRPRGVAFGTVEIRRYPIIPGDHPDCVSGPPLTIAWDHVKVSTHPIDEFEERRKENRKATTDLRIGWWHRRCLLRSLGFTDADMNEAEESAKRTRKRREVTGYRLKLSKLEEVHQSVVRKLGRAFYPKVTLETKY